MILLTRIQKISSSIQLDKIERNVRAAFTDKLYSSHWTIHTTRQFSVTTLHKNSNTYTYTYKSVFIIITFFILFNFIFSPQDSFVIDFYCSTRFETAITE